MHKYVGRGKVLLRLNIGKVTTERNEGILVRVSLVMIPHDQRQVGAAKIYHNLKRVARHPEKTGKKLKGRTWMPELMITDYYLMTW